MLAALASLALHVTGPAAPADEWIQKARRAAQVLDAADYRIRYTARLELANDIHRIEARVRRWEEAGQPTLVVEAEYRAPRTREPRALQLIREGEVWRFLDQDRAVATRGGDVCLGGDASWLLGRLDAGALLGSPYFADEIVVAASQPEVRDGESVLELSTRTADGTRTSTWLLGATDSMPRRCRRVTQLARLERLVEDFEFVEPPASLPEARRPEILARLPESVRTVPPQTSAPLRRTIERSTEPALPVTELEDLEHWSRLFAEAAGTRRVVGLFSPT